MVGAGGERGGKMARYVLLRELGNGATSRVYLAADRRDGNKYAVKCFESVQAFDVAREEMVVTGRLRHPGIPVIYESETNRDGGRIVMEYVPGMTWKEHLRKNGVLTEEQAVAWGMELCDILSYMHRQDPAVIYRDLKPGNLMITPAGRVKLIDFGAVVVGRNGAGFAAEPIGTKGFAAPEQFVRNGRVDTRTDIYGFGATMLQMMTGRHPAHMPGYKLEGKQEGARLSQKMRAILLKCIETEPDRRYRFCEEIKRDLAYPGCPASGARTFRITRSSMRLLNDLSAH